MIILSNKNIIYFLYKVQPGGDIIFNLSIIIPHYNRPNMLYKLLESIPKLDDIQVIVIDDNSDKYVNEYEKVKLFYKKYNILFSHNNQKNKGAGACRNIGINLSKGKYILFADSDDYFSEDFYDIVKQYFRFHYDIVFFSPRSIDLTRYGESNRHKKYKKLVENFSKVKNFKNEKLLRYTYYVPWSKLYLSKFLKRNNIKFQETIVSNDVLFSTVSGYRATKIEVDKRTIYIVTETENSLITIKDIEKQNIRYNVFVQYVKFLDQNNINLSLFNNFIIKFKFLIRILLATHNINYVYYYYRQLNKK